MATTLGESKRRVSEDKLIDSPSKEEGTIVDMSGAPKKPKRGYWAELRARMWEIREQDGGRRLNKAAVPGNLQQITSDPKMGGPYPHALTSQEIAEAFVTMDADRAYSPEAVLAVRKMDTQAKTQEFLKKYPPLLATSDYAFVNAFKRIGQNNCAEPLPDSWVGDGKPGLGRQFVRVLLSIPVFFLSLVKTASAIVEFGLRFLISPLTMLHRYSVGIGLDRYEGTANEAFNFSPAREVKWVKDTRKKLKYPAVLGWVMQIINIPLNIVIKKPIDTAAHAIHYGTALVADTLGGIGAILRHGLTGDFEPARVKFRRVRNSAANLLPTAVIATPLIAVGLANPTVGAQLSNLFSASSVGALSTESILATVAALLAVGLASWGTQYVAAKLVNLVSERGREGEIANKARTDEIEVRVEDTFTKKRNDRKVGCERQLTTVRTRVLKDGPDKIDPNSSIHNEVYMQQNRACKSAIEKIGGAKNEVDYVAALGEFNKNLNELSITLEHIATEAAAKKSGTIVSNPDSDREEALLLDERRDNSPSTPASPASPSHSRASVASIGNLVTGSPFLASDRRGSFVQSSSVFLPKPPRKPSGEGVELTDLSVDPPKNTRRNNTSRH